MSRLSHVWGLCLALVAGSLACDMNPHPPYEPAAVTGEAPPWARQTLYGHLSPMIALVHIDGGIVDGAGLVGKKRMIIFWDHATRLEQAEAANILQVLQKADGDLHAAGVDVLFTQIRLPTNNGRKAPMNDTDLRQFHSLYGVPGGPTVPMYRFPNAQESNRALLRGLDGSTTVYEYLREGPAIVMYDANGTIRWHSNGLVAAPPGDPVFAGKDDQFTVIQAIEFAIRYL